MGVVPGFSERIDGGCVTSARSSTASRRRARAGERALLSAGALGAAIALGAAVQAGATAALDQSIHEAMRRRRTPRVVKLARVVTSPADPKVNWIIAVVLSGIIYRRRGKRLPAPLAAVLVELVLNRVARLFVEQPRPAAARRREGRDRFAYPSGHTAATAAIAYATAIELAEGRSAGERALLFTGASLCTLAIGWSRLELEEHWANNIVGGWAMGAGSALAVTAAADAFEL
jgi:membrane-associated phospholipid phosphatase